MFIFYFFQGSKAGCSSEAGDWEEEQRIKNKKIKNKK